ncbi:hypothetical protein DdX_00735 [Ditylenchus destructor]|uniref:Uncharacterized protein n=1 Tax=Ditylenchus destructor TaxID=166010 RepID=A0AAD4NKJ5_9BILA|nr:hypothetical protein DdX_00735 [Ditylenchus destructor]
MPQDRRLRLNFHNHICKYFLLDQIFLIIFLISLFQLATLNAVEEIYEWNSTTADSLFINDNNRTDSAPPSSAEYNKENIDGSGEALLSIANEEESDRQVVKLLNGDWADYTASTTDLEGSGDDLNEMAPTHTTPSTTTQITTFRRSKDNFYTYICIQM